MFNNNRRDSCAPAQPDHPRGSFAFNCSDAESPTPPPILRAASRDLSRRGSENPVRGHVLIVEDALVNQVVAKRLVEKLGFTVDVASGGREAVAAAAHGSYDLILMDCHMPGMDGFEATRAIRAGRGPSAKVPIVAFTAVPLSLCKDECFESGMNDILLKPATSEDIANVLDRWVRYRPGAPDAGQ